MPRTLVLGLGNLLLGDEGFGVRAVAQLGERFVFPADVDLVDGGTLGLALLPVLEDADGIVLIDIVDLGQSPGTLTTLGWEDLPRAFHIKLSPHQQTIQDVLGWLEFRCGRPKRFAAIGVQPQRIEIGLALSPAVESALEPSLTEAVRILQAWGHEIEPARGCGKFFQPAEISRAVVGPQSV